MLKGNYQTMKVWHFNVWDAAKGGRFIALNEFIKNKIILKTSKITCKKLKENPKETKGKTKENRRKTIIKSDHKLVK